MLNWKDPMVECGRTVLLPIVIDNHCPKPVSKSSNVHIRCVIYGLETSIQKVLEFKLLILVTNLQSHGNLYQSKL